MFCTLDLLVFHRSLGDTCRYVGALTSSHVAYGVHAKILIFMCEVCSVFRTCELVNTLHAGFMFVSKVRSVDMRVLCGKMSPEIVIDQSKRGAGHVNARL